jgi:DNA mismatch repair protein MutS
MQQIIRVWFFIFYLITVVDNCLQRFLAINTLNYISIVLTDIVRIPDAQIKLRAKYPGLMELKYEHEAMREDMVINDIPADISNSPYELFAEFFSNANGKDMTALRNSIFVLPELKMDLEGLPSEILDKLEKNIDPLTEIYEKIDKAIVDDPPFTIKEGGVIKRGYSDELDELNDSIKDARSWIAELESKEKERTGITNLKVGYNKVFGYYLEITKSWYDHIPENYIRKQTLANAERFITPELKEMESLVMNAETKINSLEYDLFCELREYVKSAISRIQQTSAAVSTLDVLAAYADVSGKLGYVRPEVDTGEKIVIENGRHPVIEQMIQDGVFVSNDVYLDRDDSSLLLITGPNMSGKSTYMRQTAIIVLMAQSGCFVPADRAQIGVCDRIFTRIGASDNLAGGESTFYVEMSELAYILNSATKRSLVILDEIGRGTSTYDGLSIAWAVCEYMCRSDKKIRTLFASHYHELTDLDKKLDGFRNLNVDVAEIDGEVVFLHKIVEGSASRSYGIHVARIAGVPEELLESADKKLRELEQASSAMNDPDGLQLQLRL